MVCVFKCFIVQQQDKVKVYIIITFSGFFKNDNTLLFLRHLKSQYTKCNGKYMVTLFRPMSFGEYYDKATLVMINQVFVRINYFLNFAELVKSYLVEKV